MEDKIIKIDKLNRLLIKEKALDDIEVRMRSERFNQIIDDLFRSGFSLTHVEKDFALFTDGTNIIELKMGEKNGR